MWLPSIRGRPLDTVFGRMAVFATLVLFAVQAAWFTVLTIQRPRHEGDGYARGLLLVLQTVHDNAGNGIRLPPALKVRLVPGTDGHVLGGPDAGDMTRLIARLRDGLPPGSLVSVERKDDVLHLWVRYPGVGNWIVMPLNAPPPPPILIEAVAMLVAAVVLSLGAAWQMQRPMAEVAQLARRFGGGERPAAMAEKGPFEVRELIHAVNQMMRRIGESEDEKSLMLAGIAHDLKAPLTRLKLRASVLDDADSEHFSRDIDSLTHIVQQFLEFAGSEPADGPRVTVDTFLARQFTIPENGEQPLFIHALEAGARFELPRTVLDRLATNLVDNALEHGEPPVEIRTYWRGGDAVMEVRDHGPGIPEALIEEASKPFARLDSARSGDGHCGLGLAIVARLARKTQGHCEISNAPGGGLSVRIVIPVEARPGAIHGSPAT
ncbi:ATP-binding protein [Robbsia sp. Bb-Pol-6]|uniref:histidine kinase n=1 Tax=Robbsia betulipollinis TaxID=2981849 RepID=A0ABT3ZT59_9BURK|nr:ATP-binding protein [Robbsia betulipollinis]MCY0389632.1 ATP-binding protein [Robbsia betulipollinis]